MFFLNFSCIIIYFIYICIKYQPYCLTKNFKIMKKLILALTLMVAPAALFAQSKITNAPKNSVPTGTTLKPNTQVNPSTNGTATNTKPVATRPVRPTVPGPAIPNTSNTAPGKNSNINKNVPKTGIQPAITDKKKK